MSVLRSDTRGLLDGKGRDGGKIKWELSEVDTRVVSRGQDELIGEFKIAASDVISRGQDMEYTYIPTEIKRELVRFSVSDNGIL